jgi:hypothetical protein
MSKSNKSNLFIDNILKSKTNQNIYQYENKEIFLFRYDGDMQIPFMRKIEKNVLKKY